MVCKKAASKSADLTTSNNASKLDNIALIYNDATLRRELLVLEIPHNEELQFSAIGLMSSASYTSKKTHFLLFINSELSVLYVRRSLSSEYDKKTV